MIGLTANEFVELNEAQKEKAFDVIESEAQYDIVVKITSDGFKLTALVPAQAAKGAAQDAKGAAQGEDDDAAVPKSKRAKK